MKRQPEFHISLPLSYEAHTVMILLLNPVSLYFSEFAMQLTRKI